MLSFSKTFHNDFNCASSSSTQEVIKFDNIGEKSFET